MEIWDLYTKDKQLTGKTHIRGDELPDDGYHLVVHVWIKNSKNQYLISQRAADRANNPLMWECVGGSVLCGENSLQGALRETKEEVGVELDPNKGKIVYSKIRQTINGEKFNDIMDVWSFQYDGDVDLKQATTKEVAQTKWVSVQEICALYDKGIFVKTLEYFFDKILSNEENNNE